MNHFGDDVFWMHLSSLYLGTIHSLQTICSYSSVKTAPSICNRIRCHPSTDLMKFRMKFHTLLLHIRSRMRRLTRFVFVTETPLWIKLTDKVSSLLHLAFCRITFIITRKCTYIKFHITQHDMLPQHLVCKYELNCEYCNINLAGNKAPWWWSDKIETFRSVLKCFMGNYVYIRWLINWNNAGWTCCIFVQGPDFVASYLVSRPTYVCTVFMSEEHKPCLFFWPGTW